MDAKRYQYVVKQKLPAKATLRNAAMAFVVGGLICLVGQVVMDFFVGRGFSEPAASAPTAIVMVALSTILTGFGVYDRIGQWGGMGAALPITGFANSVVAPAMEYRREGMVLGIGTRMFQVAGPVLVFGFGAAFVVGLLHVLLPRFGS